MQSEIKLIFSGARSQILFDHQGHFEHDSILKLSEVKACELLYLLKAVNQSITMNKEFSGCFGNVEVILKELVNGEKSFLVEAVN